jgi:hypothetical protein
MLEEISLPLRKLLENTSLYPIVGQTKTWKLLLTELKTKHNVTVLDTMSYNSSQERRRGATFFSTLPIKKSFMFLLYL